MSQVIPQLQQFTQLGHYSRILQNCDRKLSQVSTLDPMLVRVVQGSKTIGYHGKEYHMSAGQLLVVPAGTVLDITNQNSDKQVYLADCFTWSQAILKQYELTKPEQFTDYTRQIEIISSPSNIFKLSIDYTIKLIQDSQSNRDLIFYQFMQLLRCLAIEKIYFPALLHERLTQKIERLILKSPMQKWQAQAIAKNFAMSESTLRRHLSDEGTNLSNILFEARMRYGLMLLQTTGLNIVQVAQEVGYDSGSRFAIYFRKRFGFSPKEMRR